MSDSKPIPDDVKSLVPLEQRQITFYEDEITAVVVDVDGQKEVYIPLRPICEFLGLSWPSQRNRINRDAVLSETVENISVFVTNTQGQSQHREMLSLPLDFVNGFLFGINASRVKPELKERLIQYQRECYRILSEAFQETSEVSPAMSTLVQVREMGRAIMQMAQEQIEFERRLTTTEGRLDQAAIIVGDLGHRVTTLEQRIAPGKPVTQEQASQISQTVKNVAMIWSKQSVRNEFGAVYGRLYEQFGITSYKLLPAEKFKDAMDWLDEWHRSLVDSPESPPF
jgi:hypothetical protein